MTKRLFIIEGNEVSQVLAHYAGNDFWDCDWAGYQKIDNKTVFKTARGASEGLETLTKKYNQYKFADADLKSMDVYQLAQEVMKLRNAVRYARDQRGDDKCWLDFFRLFELLPENQGMNREVLSKDQMIKNCAAFIDCMNCYLNVPDKTIDQIYESWEKEKPY